MSYSRLGFSLSPPSLQWRKSRSKRNKILKVKTLLSHSQAYASRRNPPVHHTNHRTAPHAARRKDARSALARSPPRHHHARRVATPAATRQSTRTPRTSSSPPPLLPKLFETKLPFETHSGQIFFIASSGFEAGVKALQKVLESRHLDKAEVAFGDDVESLRGRALLDVPASMVPTMPASFGDRSKWKRKSAVTLALTILTSSQAILIVWSKRAGKYEYSVTTANFMVEALKCALSLSVLARIWRNEGVTEDNRLYTTLDEVSVYPIPAALYLVKNLLQYYIFTYVDAPGYQILKNLNIISTGVLYSIILKKKLSNIQWAAFILLCAGCTTAQLNPSSDHVFQTPFQGWVMAIVMALLSGFAGVYTEAIIKKRPSRNINVQNFWLYVFGMAFNAVAILVQDFDAVMNKGFFHGYSMITVLMILNHALSGIAVSMVMKYADNIVKVYSTSVAMLLTAVVSVFLFNFHLSLAFFLGSTVVSVSVYLHSAEKLQR